MRWAGASSRARSLSGALAAGEIEVALDLALDRDRLEAAQDQAVRVEETTQVDVCKDAGRALVASSFEPVQLDRGKRVARSELVDDEHRPAGAQHAVHLCEHELGPLKVVERSRGRDEVERVRRKRQLVGVGLAKA